MAAVREAAVEAIASSSEFEKSLPAEYLRLGEMVVDEQEQHLRNGARVALNIALANLYRDAGALEDYKIYLDSILDDLYNLGPEFGDIFDVIQDEYDKLGP